MKTIKHFGDICKINGAEIPVVDIITGGSPCQDLSVAGKRAGLVGERSGLFMEQIRVGSLFSGIGGFELVFARSGAKPLWASEIESYPIAVTTQHFGDEDRGIEGDYRNYL